MLKRIFWLALACIGAWVLFRLWQQRQEDFGGTTPLLAPLEPYGRHLPPSGAMHPGLGEPSPVTTSAPPAQAAAPPEQTPAEQQDTAADSEAIVGYCARCKTRRTISDARDETTESGRRAARGTCPVCGAKMFTFLPNKTS
jgi:uncharacterized protein DUF5679